MNEDQPRASGRPVFGRAIVRAGFAVLLLLCASSAAELWRLESGGAALQQIRAASAGVTARLQQQIAASSLAAESAAPVRAAESAAPVRASLAAESAAPVRAARAPREWGLAWEAVGPFAPKGGAEIKGKWQLAEALERKLEFTRAEFDQFAVSPLKHNAYIKARGRYLQPAAIVACDEENESLPTASDEHDPRPLPPAPRPAAAPALQRNVSDANVSLAPGMKAQEQTSPPPQRGPRVTSGVRCDVLLNVMTTFIDETKDERKVRAQMAVLVAYQRLAPLGVQAWLFTQSDEWAERARLHDVRVVRRFVTNGQGTPCLSFMYKYVAKAMNLTCGAVTAAHIRFDAYVNGDIVFTKELVDTLAAARAQWWRSIAHGKRKGLMVVGRRTNTEFHGEYLTSDEEVLALAKKGRLANSDAEDYFIFSRGAAPPWYRLPGFVVGRRAYDNWLVNHAFHDQGLDMIDASNTILAVHLTAADGNAAGHNKGADNDHNIILLNPATGSRVGPHEWDDGTTNHAHFFTVKKNHTIVFVKRNRLAGARSLPEPLLQPPG